MRKKWVLCNILGVMERIIQSTHLVLSFRERRVAQGTVRGVNCDSLSFELEMPKKDSASRARFKDRSHELLRWTSFLESFSQLIPTKSDQIFTLMSFAKASDHHDVPEDTAEWSRFSQTLLMCSSGGSIM